MGAIFSTHLALAIGFALLSPDPPLPGLSVPITEIDFGTVASSQTLSHKFAIKNEGPDIISIAYAHRSCGCVSAELDSDAIAPQDTTYLNVLLDPSGYRGHVRNTVDIGFKNGTGSSRNVRFSIRAFVQDPITFSQPLISYNDIDNKADNPKGYYQSHPIVLTPVSKDISFSPVASVPDNYNLYFLPVVENLSDGYTLSVFFFPKQLLENLQERKGEFNLKVFTDDTKSLFVNLPIQWSIKSSFSITPENPIFIDNVPQDHEYLSIASVDASPFEITEITFLGSAVGKENLENNSEQSIYRLQLSGLTALMGKIDSSVRSELVIVTNSSKEPIIKVQVTKLYTRMTD
ncbi:MAG: DUF1573 domain-containing protein [Holophagaceae bacterium]|nr:DUF1573 domain-containing protein [Holophagaceae bacterium]